MKNKCFATPKLIIFNAIFINVMLLVNLGSKTCETPFEHGRVHVHNARETENYIRWHVATRLTILFSWKIIIPKRTCILSRSSENWTSICFIKAVGSFDFYSIIWNVTYSRQMALKKFTHIRLTFSETHFFGIFSEQITWPMQRLDRTRRFPETRVTKSLGTTRWEEKRIFSGINAGTVGS